MDQQIHQRCQQLEQDLSFADAMHERAEQDKQELARLTEEANEATRAARKAIEEYRTLEKMLQRVHYGSRVVAASTARNNFDGNSEVVQAIVLKR